MKEAKRRFLQEPHDVTSQKTPFFIVTTMKTSNLTSFSITFGKEVSNNMGLLLEIACTLPFLKQGITIANFNLLRKTPVPVMHYKYMLVAKL
jgi:hypothetical protein